MAEVANAFPTMFIAVAIILFAVHGARMESVSKVKAPANPATPIVAKAGHRDLAKRIVAWLGLMAGLAISIATQTVVSSTGSMRMKMA